jgi:APA family basic amino acid/polyamine antiporter
MKPKNNWKNIVWSLFRTKNLNDIQSEAEACEMHRKLSAFDLVFIGIGGIIGTGIFVLTGTVAANNSGPAIVISFIISGIAAALAALCYSELASMIPVAGSAYSYTYATLGEFIAWIIGWDLILEYLVGAATVAVGWSGYFCSFLKDTFGVNIDTKWTNSPVIFNSTTQEFQTTGDYINLPAICILLLCTVILVLGIKESALVNNITVVVKLLVVVIFIFATISFINPSNYSPFLPENTGTFGKFGWSGIFQGASKLFFAYIGFDAVSTTAQECKRPQRDLPIGIIGSLMISTILYIAVAICLTGVVSYKELDVSNPISVGVRATGISWLAVVIEIGAIMGLTSVLLITLMGQPRIFYSMACDGLLPSSFAKIHPKFGTPYITTIITGVICAILSGLLPLDVLSELTSVGTLFAFVLVSIGVTVLRFKRPFATRSFQVPFGPYVIPGAGVVINLLLIFISTSGTIIRMFAWMAIGILIYFAYGRNNSKANIEHLSNEEFVVLQNDVEKET